jgi:hypothetical protein
LSVHLGLAHYWEQEEHRKDKGTWDWEQEDKEDADVGSARVVGFVYDGLSGLLEGGEQGVHTVRGDEEEGGVLVKDLGGRFREGQGDYLDLHNGLPDVVQTPSPRHSPLIICKINSLRVYPTSWCWR